MKVRDLIAKEKDDMVAAVQANLLLQSLNTTREEILSKYPLNQARTDTEEEEHSSDGHATMDLHVAQLSQPYRFMPMVDQQQPQP